jgi:hypothetical protein
MMIQGRAYDFDMMTLISRLLTIVSSYIVSALRESSRQVDNRRKR